MSALRTTAGVLGGTIVGLVPAGAVVGYAAVAGGDTSGAALGVAILFALVGAAIGAPVGGVIAVRTKPKPGMKTQTYKQ